MRGHEDQQLQHTETTVTRTTFKVEGITCAGCATDIATVLKNTEGVVSALVDYSICEITVEYDNDEINEQQIMNILTKLGLRVQVVA